MMIQLTRLLIRLTPGPLRPKLGASTLNELRGGPETLLRWLETQLGLPCVENHRANSVVEYAEALDSLTDSIISQSMANDRWATASELLSRRDELLVSGWDQSDFEALPDVVREMARAAVGRSFVSPSIAERIARFVDALEDGQHLPDHVCILTDGPALWPKRWQSVLSKLNLEMFVDEPPAAADGTALRAAQSVVRGTKVSKFEPDSSLRYVQTLSQTAAVEFVAATLAHQGDQVERTVILCEDDQLAMQLDACLLRYGLPTMGASASSPAHPVLQVLPLSLALCWQPVDPQCLLDFLTLPVGPIPRRAATALAIALTVEPGLGSSKWQACMEELCSAENDPEGKLLERLNEWIFCARASQNGKITTKLVRDRCESVAKWATGLAIAMEAEEALQGLLAQALRVAARQAAFLGKLVQSQGSELSEPQLSRLVEEALSTGVETTGAIEAAGGPIRIHSLSEIVDPCYRVIWLGLGTGDVSLSRWSTDQLQAFRNLGIEVDDGRNSLTSLRTSETRGLCFIEDSLLAILLPQDLEKRWHPVWLAVRTILTPAALDNTPVLENLIEHDLVTSLEPFSFSTEPAVVEPPQPIRLIWSVDPTLLRDRDTVSATELEDRLACPLKWVLKHRANLRPSSIAQLPNNYRLKGSFCHKILEYAFNDGGELPSVEEAVARVERLFDERIELDAAPLAQSDKYHDRLSLRRELTNATRVLIGTLASGGYRVKGIEVEVHGEAFGKPLSGSIDCLIQRVDGSEGIIDFKYGGKKYERMIADGKAVQLATYAYSRSVLTGRFPAVAYLLLADGLLFTPSGGPINGDGSRTVVDGPGIRTVWEQFHAAIKSAEEWLTTNGQIPARPLQGSDDWPADATIVLETNLKENDIQSVCKYCDYQHLCGLRQLS